MRYRPRVEVFCFRGSRVLAGIADEGYVIFPGGGIDPSENAVEAAKREFAEEASRRLTNCTVAHPPTTQPWPDGYKNDGMKWKKGYDGGHTVWMTGSCSDELPSLKHPDYEPSVTWRPIDDVIAMVKKAKGWEKDNAVRLAILQAHQTMRLDRAPAKAAGVFPRLVATGSG
jgi:8-oxo-dGTP pyrophosphatase MutT (NUDIX family)